MAIKIAKSNDGREWDGTPEHARIIHAERAQREKDKKRNVETIDMTPTWSEIAGVIELAFTCGNSNGQAIAREELQRMAQLADRYVAITTAARARRFDTPEDAFRALADMEG